MNRANRIYLSIAGGAILLQFAGFKYFYPYADFFTDSYAYLNTAANHDVLGFRPVGYSWFLILIHCITSSDTFLVFIQYLLVQLAALYLFFSLRYFYVTGKWADRIIFAFLVFNPLILYCCNAVASDALFLGIGLFWMVELIWIIYRPSWGRLLLQLLLLACLLNIRFLALYFPVLASLSFLLCDRNLAFRISGMLTSFLVLVTHIEIARKIAEKETGVAVFSAFSAWQIANNALHIYPYIKVDPGALPSPESRQLDSLVKKYFENTGSSMEKKAPGAGTAYMWETGSPLKQYMFICQRQQKAGYFTAWNRVGPVFSQYGYYLAGKHPLLFAEYYLWPSATGYFLPQLEIFEKYNEGKREVDDLAKVWFHYPSKKVNTRFNINQAFFLSLSPWFFLFINIGFVVTGIFFLAARSYRESHPAYTRLFCLVGIYALLNAAFSIFASPSVMRYQLMPMILLTVFTAYTLSLLYAPGRIPGNQDRRNDDPLPG